MPTIPVSLDDARLDVYRHLRHPRRELAQRFFVVEGKLLLKRLLRSRFPLSSVVVIERLRVGLDLPRGLFMAVALFPGHRDQARHCNRHPPKSMRSRAHHKSRNVLVSQGRSGYRAWF